ncbi:PEP-CTERM sorting domain-containing protein [Oxynema sp. CENA135]|uniref:PEP-CTERM sorting domain-containing protein n=1 Tax=Oxynema sp. CENA135 TaxID=984206 RepID=UPI001F2DB305|nr:PEP-CTERM sorting domain-containing protein [Oxynema sp. CENA135]
MSYLPKRAMSAKTVLTTAGFALASAAFLASPVKADELTVNLSDVTNSNTENYPTVEIKLSDDGMADGTVQVTVNVVPGSTGYIGDLRGVHMNLPGGATITPVSGGPITAIEGTASDFGKIGSSANLNGSGASFTSGIEIGEQGLKGGSDDYQTVTFQVSGVSLSDFTSDTFGVRMMSVGDPNGSRSLSSKTLGTAPDTVVVTNPGDGGSEPEEPVVEEPNVGEPEGPVAEEPGGGGEPVAVPEPTTMAGLALGFGGLVAARRRKMNKDG